MKEYTKEEIENVVKEYFKDIPPILEQIDWKENGENRSCFKINILEGKGIFYIGIGGAMEIVKILEDGK